MPRRATTKLRLYIELRKVEFAQLLSELSELCDVIFLCIRHNMHACISMQARRRMRVFIHLC